MKFKKPHSLIFLPLFLLVCCGTPTNMIHLNFHLKEPLVKEKGKPIPKEIIDLLEPRKCGVANYLVTMTVYRYDLNPVKSEQITIPLSKGNELRDQLGFMAFEHYLADFKEQKNGISASELLFLPAEQNGVLSNHEDDIFSSGNVAFFCCGGTSNTFNNLEELKNTLNDSICLAEDNEVFEMVYNPNSVEGNFVSKQLENILKYIGNKDIVPSIRLKKIDEYVSLFAADAFVQEVGKNGTDFEPEPFLDYLSKVAKFQSIEYIEIVEVIKNEEGRYWKIRLRTKHENVDL